MRDELQIWPLLQISFEKYLEQVEELHVIAFEWNQRALELLAAPTA